MKKIWFMLVCLSATALTLTGCGGGSDNEGVKAAVEGGGSFPEFLVGTWIADIQGGGGQWRFVFTPDGRVSEVVEIWQEVLHPNQTTDFNMPDGPSHITAGDFFVEYRPAKRELAVRIDLKDIHILFYGAFVLDANSSDYFTGPVSEDGNTWTAERISIFSFSDLPQDPNNLSPDEEPVVFKKVQPQAAVMDSDENENKNEPQRERH